ncbi:MAG: hypothetical protein RSA22_02875 [Acinetobacter sp.]
MKNIVGYLALFFAAFAICVFSFGLFKEAQNRIDYEQIKLSPGFVSAKPSGVTTSGYGPLKAEVVVFDYTVSGNTYHTNTSRTDAAGAHNYFVNANYREVAYDTKDPQVSMLRHYYDQPSHKHETLGQILIITAIIGAVPALFLTLFIAAFTWVIKRIANSH